MMLGDLLATLGPKQLRAEVMVHEGSAVVSEVVIHDPLCPLGRGQLVLAAGSDAGAPAAGALVVAAAKAGAAGVVFRATAEPGPAGLARQHGISLLRAQPDLGWAQLAALLWTLITATAADPESRWERLAPSSGHALADAIATMTGGSVVLYDRAHRVVAYAVQGYEVDGVRRDTILGRRTPEQWVERFSADRSAYETFRDPARVVRVDGYPGLRPRLRVAICVDGEILGEISVAEGQQPLGAEAEAALLRAARLAVPYMLRHRLVEDTDRATRTRLLQGLLFGEISAVPQLGLAGKAGFAVAGFAGDRIPAGEPASLLGERVLHLLSLHMSSIDPAAGVILAETACYALIPIGDGRRLPWLLEPALRQLERIGVILHAAVGPWVPDLAAVPAARQTVDDLLHIQRRRGQPGGPAIVTVQDRWSDLALLPAERALAGSAPCAQLQRLLDHDERQRTDYTTTLRVYLEEFGSVSRASERLVLHQNTLRHRLARLAVISGLDLSDPAQRLAVALQLRVLGSGRKP